MEDRSGEVIIQQQRGRYFLGLATAALFAALVAFVNQIPSHTEGLPGYVVVGIVITVSLMVFAIFGTFIAGVVDW